MSMTPATGATNVPPEMVRPPMVTVAPEKSSTPSPVLVSGPLALLPVVVPAWVTVVPAATLNPPPPAPKLMPRLGSSVSETAVESVPPEKLSRLATGAPGGVPRAASAVM